MKLREAGKANLITSADLHRFGRSLALTLSAVEDDPKSMKKMAQLIAAAINDNLEDVDPRAAKVFLISLKRELT